MDSYLIFLSAAALLGATASIGTLFEAWKDKRAAQAARPLDPLEVQLAIVGLIDHFLLAGVMLSMLALFVTVIILEPGEVRGAIVRWGSAVIVIGLGILSIYNLLARRAIQVGLRVHKGPDRE